MRPTLILPSCRAEYSILSLQTKWELLKNAWGWFVSKEAGLHANWTTKRRENYETQMFLDLGLSFIFKSFVDWVVEFNFQSLCWLSCGNVCWRGQRAPHQAVIWRYGILSLVICIWISHFQRMPVFKQAFGFAVSFPSQCYSL